MNFWNLWNSFTTGKLWYDKVKDVQKKMEEEGTTAHVIQSLDSIACKYTNKQNNLWNENLDFNWVCLFLTQKFYSL